MANRQELKAETRKLFGSKVGRLRRSGIMPATVYGHNVKPQSIQFHSHDLLGLMRTAGTTQLIDLVVDEQAARPVLIKQTAIDAKRNAVIHVEFFQANLRETLHTSMPVHFVGESSAVKEGGILLTVMDHVNIESLPQNVPAGGIEVDISQITEINGQINAGDIVLPSNVTLLTPADEMIAKVNPPITEAAMDEILAEPVVEPEEFAQTDEPADADPEA